LPRHCERQRSNPRVQSRKWSKALKKSRAPIAHR
jgi:hypothetical protein